MPNETTNNWKEREMGAFWKKNGGKGTFLAGKITIDGKEHKVVVYKNTFKEEGDNKPDYRIYRDDYKPQGGSTPAPAAKTVVAAKPVKKPAPVAAAQEEDDAGL
jgi:hypothetical protein